ncbi:hypothetical protein M9Y10_003575 [Tritrichomonas musculus]|uniref:Surface antigen BspA-like n=1 Tax=Tritrichomonas musculus TaxID=1915356 RepID=A0ABR2JRQ5_9EUKA
MKSKCKSASTKKSKNKQMTAISTSNASIQPMDANQILILQQQFQDYVNSKRELYDCILDFLEDSKSNEDLSKIIDIIQKQFINNREEFEHLLHLLNHISNNHHREENLLTKTFQIIEYYQDQIKKTFSNFEIFNIFEDNKLILLFLFEKKILQFDLNIYNAINSKIGYCHFFYPEIEEFLGEEKSKDIKNELLSIDPYIFENFDKKRHRGQNDSPLCRLIIEDSAEEFISYANMSNISLRRQIERSTFETDPFLIENQPTLIEYSAFYGSIQIFQYLMMNKVELTSSLWLYAIHSKNADLIHLLEYNDVKPPNDRYDECYDESIKCHHNDISSYIENTLIAREKIIFQDKEKIVFNIFKYHNFPRFPNDFYDDDEFFYLIRYKFNKLLNIFLTKNRDWFEQMINELKPKDVKKNKVLYAYFLLLKKKSIDDNSYKNNNLIKKIAIPASIVSIGNDAFNGCKKLVKVIIPSSVTSIGNNAFNGCTSLSEIIIPSSIRTIGSRAFFGCSSLLQIIIPSSVKSIDIETFSGCSSLSRIIIPSSVRTIGSKAFLGCSSLLYIAIPSLVTSIGDGAFRSCSSIKEITIPSSMTSINKSMFTHCLKLRSITIPESVKNIGNDVFNDCYSLTQISIPSSVDSIGNNTFRKCSSLVEISIPDSVISIGNDAFYGCSNLSKIKISSSLKTIGNNAFYNCSSLIDVALPESVISIGNKAFYGCSNLTKLKMPNSTISVGNDAFHGCKFEL